MEVELEKTFLVKELPPNLDGCVSAEIIDIYIPSTEKHPFLRIRKRGDKFEITKKEPIDGKDSSEQYEKTIPLTEKEFNELAVVKGKRFRKQRYYYPQKDEGVKMELDFYLDDLEGLVVVDFEFETKDQKDNFQMPDFCLADVTQEKAFAGGMLAGKKYADIEEDLKKYNYKKIIEK